MNIDMIRAAEARIGGRLRHTPFLSSPFLDRIVGRRILVKPECLQHTGSFKYRGASAALSALSPEARARGVVAFSSGNHAQGVALAGAEQGAPVVILMPSDAPAVKIANTRALGAEVILYDRRTEDRDALGARIAGDRGLTLVRPYDDPQVIAGQGTVGLEIAAEARALGIDRAEVFVPCGGGGLTSGIALALEADAPGLTVRPCEPETHDDMRRSLLAGAIRGNENPRPSLCDAIVTPAPGNITFPLVSARAGAGLAVSDDEALKAVGEAWQRLRIVAEPGGAVALAAALYRTAETDADTIIAVVSGGNVDAAIFRRALDLVAAA